MLVCVFSYLGRRPTHFSFTCPAWPTRNCAGNSAHARRPSPPRASRACQPPAASVALKRGTKPQRHRHDNVRPPPWLAFSARHTMLEEKPLLAPSRQPVSTGRDGGLLLTQRDERASFRRRHRIAHAAASSPQAHEKEQGPRTTTTTPRLPRLVLAPPCPLMIPQIPHTALAERGALARRGKPTTSSTSFIHRHRLAGGRRWHRVRFFPWRDQHANCRVRVPCPYETPFGG